MSPSLQPSHEADLDIATLVLDVVNRKIKGLDYHVENSILEGEIDRTIEGASTLTLTVHDPKRVLLRSGMFAYAIDTRLDRLFFRLVQVQKQGSDLALTFEDREVAYLRSHRKARKASRGKVTRAQFALSLVREVKQSGGIKFVCPELTVKQRVGKAGITTKRDKRKSSGRKENRQKGLASGASLTIKGAKATPEQRKNAERILDVADSANAGPKATLALVEACIVEPAGFRYPSGAISKPLTNPPGGDRDSQGILQVRDQTAHGMGINNRDVEACANAFLKRGFWGKGSAIELARKNPGQTAGWVAQQTQGSAYPTRYDEVRADAQKVVDAYTGGGGSSGSSDVPSTTSRKAYEFRRGTQDGKREDSWTCLQRLAEEVNWRCFMSAGKLYFVAEDYLMKSKPRLVITETTEGVLDIDFDLDHGKISDEVALTCRASRWIAAPGSVVQLDDCGPADGRWLVSSIRRGLFDAEATVTLRRPAKRLPEPDDAGTTTTKTSKRGSGSAQSGGNVPSSVQKAYARAKAIDRKNQPYKWGGGHGSFNDPGGYDCSGFVSSCLNAAGLLSGSPQATPGLKGWGMHGEGQYMTVWVKETGVAHQSHTFLTFDLNQDGKKVFAEAGGGNSAHTGIHTPRSTAGFEPRHAGNT